jgi:hypothetical protein
MRTALEEIQQPWIEVVSRSPQLYGESGSRNPDIHRIDEPTTYATNTRPPHVAQAFSLQRRLSSRRLEPG